jgi:hemerythrin-like domain-containing protein
MPNLTQPLRDEHQELLPFVEEIRQAADAVYESLTTNAHAKIEDTYRFLIHHLLPHAQAEEAALYPMVQKAMECEQATATMLHDHQEIARLTEELETLRVHKSLLSITSLQAMAFRRVLYGLYALIKVHFAKEEEIYLPLLDAKLTAEEAQAMFQKMEVAAKAAKQNIPH